MQHIPVFVVVLNPESTDLDQDHVSCIFLFHLVVPFTKAIDLLLMPCFQLQQLPAEQKLEIRETNVMFRGKQEVK